MQTALFSDDSTRRKISLYFSMAEQDVLAPTLLPYIFHFVVLHPADWDPHCHYRFCGQSCPCCRGHNPEDYLSWSCCEGCGNAWTFTCVSKLWFICIKMYPALQREAIRRTAMQHSLEFADHSKFRGARWSCWLPFPRQYRQCGHL